MFVILIYSFDLEMSITIRHTLFNIVVVLNIKLQPDSSSVLDDFLCASCFFYYCKLCLCGTHHANLPLNNLLLKYIYTTKALVKQSMH